MSFVSTNGTGSRLPAIRWLAFCSVLALAGIAVSSALPSPASQARVVLTVAVTGKGKVASAPRGIACPSNCRARYPSRATVRLTVKPASGWAFSRWGGACAMRKSLICNVRMNAPRSVRAVFRRRAAPKPVTPSCTRALTPDAAKVLAYLGRLSNGTEPGVIVGQACRPMWFICDDTRFQESVGALHDQSGKWPGIIDVSYDGTRVQPPDELSSANQRLVIPYSRAGGLVTVSWGPVNPWGSDPQNGWPDIATKYPGADLHDLLPGGAKRLYWLRSLDRIGAALTELRDAGVVVLFRPMQEMNGNWFWWAREKHEIYARLWRDMFDYFTCVKGLNNLLWVFAPADHPTLSPSSYADAYPGADYVDILAPTAYRNDLVFGGYDQALTYGKPIALSEYGPSAVASDLGANGSFDDRLYIQRLQHDYPRIAYFVSWNSWEGVKMSLADNLYASELMNDPRVITRDKIAWR
jgi:mannan endo-1,4-beta-mannosidase